MMFTVMRMAISKNQTTYSLPSLVPWKNLTLLKSVRDYCKPSDRKQIDVSRSNKESKPVYIILVGLDGVRTTSSLESAMKLSKRRNLKLVKTDQFDTVKCTPVYKLLSSTEVLKEDLESKKNKQKNDSALKSPKILAISDCISCNDLDSKLKQVLKWIEKKHEVRCTINGSSINNKTEAIFNDIEDKTKSHGRILQKRTSGNDIKFQIIPLKPSKSAN